MGWEQVSVSSYKQSEKLEFMNTKIGNQNAKSIHSLKYLAVIIDNRAKDHVSYVSAMAAKIPVSLVRMMPTFGKPKAAIRVFVTVVTSVIFYASPVWPEDVTLKSERRKSIYRLN